MTDFEQEPFGGGGADEFVDNPEPRCPVVLLLDTSLSMQGPKIDALNAGLLHFHEELSMDPLAMKRVEVAVVTFGPVAVQSDYVSAEHFDPPTLEASGNTPMGGAILRAIDLLRERKQKYREAGGPLLPALGVPDHRRRADRQRGGGAQPHRGGRGAQGVHVHAVGVEGADMGEAAGIATPSR
jgi:Uncharacterized protein encoded in toxicity protection region of plasmid R478, contains von Willebrand factor (vWF) domain